MRKQEKIDGQKQRKRRKLLKRIALWVAVIAGINAFVFGMIKLVDNYSPGQLVNGSISDSDWVKGNRNAEVILVEYSDFQCSACANYVPIIEQLVQEFGEELGFIYRHFPLKQNHRNAELAAWAAEAAGKQGKFWEMYSLIFENQNEWSLGNAEKIFTGYAESLELNIEKFKKDINSKEIKEKVENDYQGGLRSGINSTPTFFLNGTKIRNPRNYGEFQNIISRVLAENS